jgi:excisionase family DNA binding protein
MSKKKQTNPADDLVGVAAAAAALGVKDRQVRNLIASGLLPARMIGGTWLISRSALAGVPKNRKRGPKPRFPQ